MTTHRLNIVYGLLKTRNISPTVSSHKLFQVNLRQPEFIEAKDDGGGEW